jgi:hypothetical protein
MNLCCLKTTNFQIVILIFTPTFRYPRTGIHSVTAQPTTVWTMCHNPEYYSLSQDVSAKLRYPPKRLHGITTKKSTIATNMFLRNVDFCLQDYTRSLNLIDCNRDQHVYSKGRYPPTKWHGCQRKRLQSKPLPWKPQIVIPFFHFPRSGIVSSSRNGRRRDSAVGIATGCTGWTAEGSEFESR